MVLIGASVGVRNENQIVIDVIDMFVKGRNARKALAVFQYVIQIIAVVLLLYSSITLVQLGARQRSTALAVLMSKVYMCFPIGYSLILIEQSIKFISLLLGKFEEKKQQDIDTQEVS
jgi:TRAP-type C4-dicarboxylate transport system permease small subunit